MARSWLPACFASSSVRDPSAAGGAAAARLDSSSASPTPAAAEHHLERPAKLQGAGAGERRNEQDSVQDSCPTSFGVSMASSARTSLEEGKVMGTASFSAGGLCSTGTSSTTSAASSSSCSDADVLSAVLCNLRPVHAPNPQRFRRARTELPASPTRCSNWRQPQPTAAPEPITGASRPSQLTAAPAANTTCVPPHFIRLQTAAAYLEHRDATAPHDAPANSDIIDGTSARQLLPRLAKAAAADLSIPIPAVTSSNVTMWPTIKMPCLQGLPPPLALPLPLAPLLHQLDQRAAFLPPSAAKAAALPTLSTSLPLPCPNVELAGGSSTDLTVTVASLAAWAAVQQQAAATLTLARSIQHLVSQEEDADPQDKEEEAEGEGGSADPPCGNAPFGICTFFDTFPARALGGIPAVPLEEEEEELATLPVAPCASGACDVGGGGGDGELAGQPSGAASVLGLLDDDVRGVAAFLACVSPTGDHHGSVLQQHDTCASSCSALVNEALLVELGSSWGSATTAATAAGMPGR